MKRSSETEQSQAETTAAENAAVMPEITPVSGKKGKKQRKPRFALRYYVWFYFMIFAVVILMLIWLFQYILFDQYYESTKLRDIANVADQIEKAGDEEQQKYMCKKLAFENNLCILITDESGNKITGSNNLGEYSTLYTDVMYNFSRHIYDLKAKVNKSKDGKHTETVTSEDTNFKGLIYGEKMRGDSSDSFIFIECSVEPIDSTISIIREQLIYITVILIELAFLVTLFISKRISRPITSITNTAKQFAAGDYNMDFKGEGYKEVEELSNVLNNAKNEIRKVSDLRKDLIANISHDLRTPLTSALGYVRLAQYENTDEAERTRELEITERKLHRLQELIDQFFEFYKVISKGKQPELSQLNLIGVIEESVSHYYDDYNDRGRRIELNCEKSNVPVLSNKDMLMRVFDNLTNNAMKHGRETLYINVDPHERIVTFRNNTLDKNLDPSHVFDEFYTTDSSRTAGSTGLGMAIAKQFIEILGGSINASLNGEDFVVTVKLGM